MIKLPFIILLLICLCGCKTTHEKSVITVINEYQPCAEEDYAHRLIKQEQFKIKLESSRDSIVLLLFDDSVNFTNHYTLFCGDSVDQVGNLACKHRVKSTLEGYWLDDKISNDYATGCWGGSIFTITKVLKLEVVTESMNFSLKVRSCQGDSVSDGFIEMINDLNGSVTDEVIENIKD